MMQTRNMVTWKLPGLLLYIAGRNFICNFIKWIEMDDEPCKKPQVFRKLREISIHYISENEIVDVFFFIKSKSNVMYKHTDQILTLGYVGRTLKRPLYVYWSPLFIGHVMLLDWQPFGFGILNLTGIPESIP